MPEDMKDQNLLLLDMRLHTRMHLVRISMLKKNGANGKKDTNEIASQTYLKNDGKLGGPQRESEDLEHPKHNPQEYTSRLLGPKSPHNN